LVNIKVSSALVNIKVSSALVNIKVSSSVRNVRVITGRIMHDVKEAVKRRPRKSSCLLF
jgi:hypothetical protein